MIKIDFIAHDKQEILDMMFSAYSFSKEESKLGEIIAELKTMKYSEKSN